MKGNVGREGHQCPGWTPNLVYKLLWPGIAGSREGGLGAGGPSQNFGHHGVVIGGGSRYTLPRHEQRLAGGSASPGRRAGRLHDQTGSGLPAMSERASPISCRRTLGLWDETLKGQVRSTRASFGRAKQDLRRVDREA